MDTHGFSRMPMECPWCPLMPMGVHGGSPWDVDWYARAFMGVRACSWTLHLSVYGRSSNVSPMSRNVRSLVYWASVGPLVSINYPLVSMDGPLVSSDVVHRRPWTDAHGRPRISSDSPQMSADLLVSVVSVDCSLRYITVCADAHGRP